MTSELIELLRSWGFHDRQIERMSLETRLYHDLGFEGDTAEEIILSIVSKYGVDMSKFKFSDYFPDEFPGQSRLVSIVLGFIPYGRAIYYRNTEFKPLTIGAIEEAILRKAWVEASA
jgi:hypothetical protein